MDIKPIPCCKCHKYPHIKCEPGGLWYVYCSCSKWNKYEFLATSSKKAISNWNDANISSQKYTNKDKK